MQLPLSLDRPLVFFDLETTGLKVGTDRIVEMALIRVSPQGDVLERVRRFNPGIPIPPEASAVHGITDADVADEPPFASRARALAKLLEGCDLAGFNIRRFDLPMLEAEFARAGVAFEVRGRRLLDMQTIFHREEPRDLTAAARYYLGRDHTEAHTALGDIRTTAAVLSAQMARYPHLPQDLDGLHAYCDEHAPYDGPLGQWFRVTDEGLIFRKGKHEGRFLEEVARADDGYLEWILRLDDTRPQVAQSIRNALEGLGRGGSRPSSGSPP
ncbi:MAG: 3'-5' exonuclease [Longimicrobiales bacterium]|nr:3'-5' exonuclease [Longimicrobiales bacterium]